MLPIKPVGQHKLLMQIIMLVMTYMGPVILLVTSQSKYQMLPVESAGNFALSSIPLMYLVPFQTHLVPSKSIYYMLPLNSEGQGELLTRIAAN